MRVTSVEYRRLRSFGQYENETVGATAAVSEGETPEAALSALRDWVAGQLALAAGAEEIEEFITELQSKKRHIESAVASGERKYAALRDILAAHNIELPKNPESPAYDLPF